MTQRAVDIDEVWTPVGQEVIKEDRFAHPDKIEELSEEKGNYELSVTYSVNKNFAIHKNGKTKHVTEISLGKVQFRRNKGLVNRLWNLGILAKIVLLGQVDTDTLDLPPFGVWN